jgi:hypothetical protein
VLTAAVICVAAVQTGGNGWFIVSRLKELVANPPAPCTEEDSSVAAASAGSASRAEPGRSAAAGGAAGKAGGGEVSPNSKSPQGKAAKSGKILGVHLSGSSSSKSSGLVGLKVSHGVESFASAASAMASVISRNASSSKHKHSGSSSSNTNSPTNTGEASKVTSSAPSSSCGSAVPPTDGAGGAPTFGHSVSCRMGDRRHDKAITGSDGGAALPAGAPGSGCSGAAAAAMEQANGSEQKPSTATGAQQPSTGSRLAQQAAGQQASQDGPIERSVPADVFEVLSTTLNSILEVASAQDDSRVVLAVLELASSISCTTGGAGLRSPSCAGNHAHILNAVA